MSLFSEDNVFAFGMPGPMELCLIAGVGVLLFGSQLPKVARSLGAAIPSFKKGLSDVRDDLDECEKEIKKVV